MAAHDIPDRPDISLVTVPPRPLQRNLAVAIVVVLLVGFAAAIPFAATPLPRLNAFIPTLQAVLFVTDLITAVLLFGHFTILRTRALLVIANAYFFSALIVLPYGLSFPGAFAPEGLFGGLNTAVWLYVFWHVGFALGVGGYACLKDQNLTIKTRRLPARLAIPGSLIVVGVLVGGLTWIAARADRLLPGLFANEIYGNALLPIAAIACSLASAGALAMLWRRRSSILDLWLMVALCAGVTEPLLTAVPVGIRYSLGFYASRAYSVVTSTVVLAALLSEMTVLYAMLSRNMVLLQRERRNKLMNVEAVVASITHEVRQPLSAIAANGSAALLLLDHAEPDLDEARDALNAILQDSFNASRMFDSVRALFKSADQRHDPVDVNEMTVGALQMLRGALTERGITTSTEFGADLPPVPAHKVQLQEVVINLVNNAIDAMDTTQGRPRILRVRTDRHDGSAVVLSVQDSGPGIDPQSSEDIFDPFVTTKPHGMGLGLAICRMIVERHGGRISAASEAGKGALFQMVLPAGADRPGAT